MSSMQPRTRKTGWLTGSRRLGEQGEHGAQSIDQASRWLYFISVRRTANQTRGVGRKASGPGVNQHRSLHTPLLKGFFR